MLKDGYSVARATRLAGEPRLRHRRRCCGFPATARSGDARFGSTLNPHLHFPCVGIDGGFDTTAAGNVVFHAATGIDANTIAQLEAWVRRRVLRSFVQRGLLPGDAARAMGPWAHGGGFSVAGSVRIEAADRTGRERLLRYAARPPLALARLREPILGRDMRHCVLTLVERKTGFAIIKKLSARNKDQVTRAATRAIRRHCRHFKTLTLDNGTEFHDYALLEQRFPVRVYFATPYHSWERGCNENFNGLLRQYLPKGVCMSTVTQAQCNHIADDLNNRPRKRFGFDTPAALYHRN
jgi:hypothetical protein